MKTEPKTKVIFRRWPAEKDSIIALFPALAASVGKQGECLSYQTIGQHGAASIGLMRCTVPATRLEYADLATELRRAGYRLDIRQRFTPADHAARREQLK